jgi:rhodanese-related sulfurtransferase
MDRMLEFALNHFELVAVLVGLLVALYWVESLRSGATVSPQLATQLINRDNAVVLDIRPSNEYGEGHITGAVNIPFDRFKERARELDKHKGQIIILVCKMGQHSGSIAKQLRQEGFTDVRRLAGGISSWTAEQLPLVKT